MRRKVKVAVLGAGSAGIYALGQIRRRTDDFVIIDGGTLGTTCSRVGCMPSKALIQVADDLHRGSVIDKEGIRGGASLSLDVPAALAHVREIRDSLVGRLLDRFLPGVGERLIRANAEFVAPNVVRAGDEEIEAEAFVIAVGSRPVVPQAWRQFGERVLTTDEVFEQTDLPPKMGVLGLGAIGLELGQALHRFGIEVTGVDLLTTIGGLRDPEVSDHAERLIGAELPMWLGAPAELEEAEDGRLRVRAGERQTVVDKVLVSLGRRPNLDRLALERAGVAVDAHGLPEVDPETMRIGERALFIAGDADGLRPVLHEAGDEGRIAGYNAARTVMGEPPVRFVRKPEMGIVFCDPNIAVIGTPWSELEDREEVVVGRRDFASQSRAMVMLRNAGLLRLYGDRRDGRLLGAAMVAPHGEHLAHLLAWSIHQQLTVFDLLTMPFYHPVIEEGLQNALYDLAGKIERRPEGLLELAADHRHRASPPRDR